MVLQGATFSRRGDCAYSRDIGLQTGRWSIPVVGYEYCSPCSELGLKPITNQIKANVPFMISLQQEFSTKAAMKCILQEQPCTSQPPLPSPDKPLAQSPAGMD